MHHAFTLGETEHNVELSRSPGAYRLHLGETLLDIGLATDVDGRQRLRVGDRHWHVVVTTRGDNVFVHLDGEAHQLRYQHPLDRLAAQAGGSAEESIRAPMPGSVLTINVAVGEAVSKGQILMVMESMKMETAIAAPRDGVIAAIAFEKGQTFERDALLLSLDLAEVQK
jgi:biotin carboxyl carrier protein